MIGKGHEGIFWGDENILYLNTFVGYTVTYFVKLFKLYNEDFYILLYLKTNIEL